MDNNSFSRYRNIKSTIHMIDPRIKLLEFILIIATIFIAQTPELLTLAFLFVFIISLLSRVRFWSYFKILYIVLPFFIIMSLIYAPIYSDFLLGIKTTGLMTFRLYIFILLSIIFTSTTKEIEIANAFGWLIYPLKYIKVPTYEIAMLITLTLRFIPLMIGDLSTIMMSQTSRGYNAINGNIKEKLVGIYNSLLPMLYISFQRAEDISIAMTIRGYEVGQERTKYYDSKFFILEWITLLITLLFLVLIILINVDILTINLY